MDSPYREIVSRLVRLGGLVGGLVGSRAGQYDLRFLTLYKSNHFTVPVYIAV